MTYLAHLFQGISFQSDTGDEAVHCPSHLACQLGDYHLLECLEMVCFLAETVRGQLSYETKTIRRCQWSDVLISPACGGHDE